MVQVGNVCSACYKAIVILVLGQGAVSCCIVWELRTISLALRTTMLYITYLIWSNRRSYYRLLSCQLLARCANDSGCLRLRATCWLRSTLEIFYIDGACLLFTLSRSIIVGNWCRCLSYVVSFAHKCVLTIILLLVLNILLAIRAINDILSIWTKKLSVFESFLLVLLIHMILALAVLLRA